MRACIYVSIVYIYICTYLLTSVCVFICGYIGVYIGPIFMNACVYACICAYMHMNRSTGMYACVCMFPQAGAKMFRYCAHESFRRIIHTSSLYSSFNSPSFIGKYCV
jgi:hypothetical protein